MDIQLNYASFSRRLVAAFLDLLLLFIPAMLLGQILPFVGSLLVWFFYAPFLEASVVRATVGKKLMGIQVVDLGGGRISFRASLVRSLMKLVSSFLLFVPHLLALFTARQQALHDMVAESVVVYGRAELPIVDAWVDSVKGVMGSSGMMAVGTKDRLTELERLQALYERGALSKEEFDLEKAKILNRPT